MAATGRASYNRPMRSGSGTTNTWKNADDPNAWKHPERTLQVRNATGGPQMKIKKTNFKRRRRPNVWSGAQSSVQRQSSAWSSGRNAGSYQDNCITGEYHGKKGGHAGHGK